MNLEPPADLNQLCTDLGIGLKRRARLAEDKGEELVPWLQKMWLWARRRDKGRFLHRHATASTPDYVENAEMAMWGAEGGEPEAVPEDYQNVLVMEAHHRHAKRRHTEAKDEHAEEQARHLGKQIRDLAVAINRAGGNPIEFLARIQREVSAKRDELRDVA